MTSVSLSPILNEQTVKENGDPASGWKIYSYVAGTTTPATTYSDQAGTIPNSNPIILNSLAYPTQGEVWLVDGTFYKFIITDENDVSKRTFDNISGVNDSTQGGVDQWVPTGLIPTFLTPNSFSVPQDQVTEFHIGRRAQMKVGVGFVYGYITNSTFASNKTTVTLKMDGAQALNNGLSEVNLSLLRSDHHALPKIDYELNSLLVGEINMTGADNWAAQVTLPSAATVDIGAAGSNSILITGTTTINSFGVAAAGILRMVEFQSSLTLTYNATSMQLPGSANITTQPNDILFAYSKGGGNWKVIAYQKYAQPPGGGAGIPLVQVFSTPGSFNFTVPAGVTRVKVTVVGGGQSAYLGGYINYGAGTAIKTISGLTPGQVIPVVVGAGGVTRSDGVVTPLQNGGTSSFGSFCSATGSAYLPPFNPFSGLMVAGVGINGDINMVGASGAVYNVPVPEGQPAFAISLGGGSFLSGLGSTGFSANGQANPNAYGAGGNTMGTVAGPTNGGSGIVMVEY